MSVGIALSVIKIKSFIYIFLLWKWQYNKIWIVQLEHKEDIMFIMTLFQVMD